jgi:hypothetical protein
VKVARVELDTLLDLEMGGAKQEKEVAATRSILWLVGAWLHSMWGDSRWWSTELASVIYPTGTIGGAGGRVKGGAARWVVCGREPPLPYEVAAVGHAMWCGHEGNLKPSTTNNKCWTTEGQQPVLHSAGGSSTLFSRVVPPATCVVLFG